MKWKYMEIVAASSSNVAHCLTRMYVTQCPASDILMTCNYMGKNLRNLVPDVLANCTTDSDDMAVSENNDFFGD